MSRLIPGQQSLRTRVSAAVGEALISSTGSGVLSGMSESQSSLRGVNISTFGLMLI